MQGRAQGFGGDSPVSLKLRILAGKMYVFDRAYNDYDFWGKIVEAKSDFVTRLKDCPRNRMLQMRVLLKVGNKNGVLYDGLYQPTSSESQKMDIRRLPLAFKCHRGSYNMNLLKINRSGLVCRGPNRRMLFPERKVL